MSYAIRIRMSVPNAPDNALEKINATRDTFTPVFASDTVDTLVSDCKRYAKTVDDGDLLDEIVAYWKAGGSYSDTTDQFLSWTDDGAIVSAVKDWRPGQETRWSHVTPDTDLSDAPEHYESVLRFDERDDFQSILDDITNNRFPSVEWVVIHSHPPCYHERVWDKFQQDEDYPDGSPGKCGDWAIEFERGNVPESLR